MAYSSLWCRLNKVSFTFTMTSSKTRPEGGEDEQNQPTLLKPQTSLSSADLEAQPPGPLQNPSRKVKPQGRIFLPMQGWKCSRDGGTTLAKDKPGQSKSQWYFGNFPPITKSKRVHLKLVQRDSGLSQDISIWCDANSVPNKSGITSHLEERCPRHRGQPISLFTQGETINLHLHQDRNLRLCNCSWDSILAS